MTLATVAGFGLNFGPTKLLLLYRSSRSTGWSIRSKCSENFAFFFQTCFCINQMVQNLICYILYLCIWVFNQSQIYLPSLWVKFTPKLESPRLKLKSIKNWVNDTLLWNVLVWFWSGFNFLEMLKCHAIWSYLKFLYVGMAETWSYNTCLLRVNHSLLFFIIGMYSWNLTSISYQKKILYF